MAPAPPPFRRIGAELPATPVVLSVPHAGRSYPDALLNISRLPRAQLEILEDRLVDQLVWRAVAGGAVAFVADSPRAEIDLNRDEREVEAGMIAPRPRTASLVESARTKGGLGLIPSRISGRGAIWRQRLPAAELNRRIQSIHRPYHVALETALEETRQRFGIAILLDCHSMPPRTDAPGEPPVVLGDRYGTSIASTLVAAAEIAVRDAGFTVGRNSPYAGGHITSRHGRPEAGIHALQIEVDRSLYLAADLRTPGPDFDRIARLFANVASALANKALEPPQAIAAE